MSTLPAAPAPVPGPPPRPTPAPRDFSPAAAAALLLAAAFVVYWPALHGTLLWDDTLDLTENPLLRDLAGPWRIWFAPTTLDYYPLKFTVQWLQWQLWGERVLGYHVTNVVLHACGAWLLGRVFLRLGLRFAWLGALVFVVHPIVVESVAWIAELKNTLSLPPLLLALLAWLDFDASRARRDYVRALAWFLGAMLCKTSVVMFPVTLALVVWWRHGRIRLDDARRLAPFFGLSLVLGLVTLRLQFGRALGGEALPLGGPLDRLALSGATLAFYAWKSLWPSGLLPIYPPWRIDPASLAPLASWSVLAGLTAWSWRRRATWGRHVALGLGWFVLHLLPFLGFVPISFMRFTWAMDHFTYVPLPGLIGLALAACDRLPAPRVVLAAGVAVCLVLGSCAQRHAATYRSPRAFWSHALAHFPDAWIARNNLGLALAEERDLAGALREYQHALRLKPDYFEARMNLGNTLRQLGRPDDGIAALRAALALKPRVALAHYNLALALLDRGRQAEAFASVNRALELRPGSADALDTRGELLRLAGRHEEAQRDLAAALRLSPAHAHAHLHLASSLSATGQIAAAIVHYDAALRLRPDYAEAHNNYATALTAAGRGADALQHLRRAVALRPDYLDARLNLAVTLVKTGLSTAALPHLETVLAVQPESLRAHYHLGLALAALDRHESALASFERALALDASFAVVHAALADSLAALGRLDEARMRHTHARALDPSLPPKTF